MNSPNEKPWHHDVITNCGLRSVPRVQTCCNMKWPVAVCIYVRTVSWYFGTNRVNVFRLNIFMQLILELRLSGLNGRKGQPDKQKR